MYNSQRCAVSWANNPAQQQHMPVKVNNKERKDPAQLWVSYLKEKKTHLSPKVEQRASSKHKQGARWKPCQFKKDTWNSKKHFDIRNKTQTHYKIKKYTVRYFMPSKKKTHLADNTCMQTEFGRQNTAWTWDLPTWEPKLRTPSTTLAQTTWTRDEN